jgi:hypothetical protein
MKFVFSEVVRAIDLDPYEIAHPGAEPLKFRVEILRRSDTQKFYARIYRSETFRVQPTFPQSKGKPIAKNQGDHEIFVLDDFLGAGDFKGTSVEEVLRKVEKAINKLFAQ